MNRLIRSTASPASLLDDDGDHLARLLLFLADDRDRLMKADGRLGPPAFAMQAGPRESRSRGRSSAAQTNRPLHQHQSLNSTTGRRKGVATFQTWPLSVVGIVPPERAERILTRLLERRRSR